MTYNPRIPESRDDISVSQGELLTNFGQLNTQFAVNHVAFDDAGADKGKHKFVTFVEQAADPETLADELIIYAKDDGGEPELFVRPETDGDAFQLTKDGNVFCGMLPVVAVNFDAAGAIQGSDLNVASVSRPGGTGRYVINFTSALPNNDYFWSASGFYSGSSPVIAQVTNSGTYGSVVTTTTISIDFKDENDALISTITRGCVVCWRFQ